MKRMTVRLTALLLLAVLSLALVSCGEYKPVKSSDSDARVIATFEGEEVRFELVRALLLAYKAEYDGGDPSSWQGEGGSALFAEALADTMEQIAEIYATFRICLENGIDPYGKEVNELVSDRVEIDIDGGILDGNFIEGYGSKKKYLAALEERGLTDSVNRLLHRWDACLALLYEQMITDFDDGANIISREEVRAFYDSEDCARISWVFISRENSADDTMYRGKAQRARAALLECHSYAEMSVIVAQNTLNLSYDQIDNGFCLATNGGIGSGDRKLCETAAELDALEISEIIETDLGLYVLIGLPKSATYYGEHYEEIHDLALEHRLYESIDTAKELILGAASYTDLYHALSAADFFEVGN